MELRPRLRRRPARRRRLPGGPGARAGPARAARRRRDGLARRADARRRQAPADRHVAAVPAAARAALPGGVERGASATAPGAGGPRGCGEKLRQAVDLEHWAAFQDAFQDGRADGPRGRRRQARQGAADGHVPVRRRAPLLRRRGATRPHWAGSSRIIQAVCSPIRNPLPRKMRFATAALAYAVAGPMGKLVARSAKVPERAVLAGTTSPARGSTTASPSSRTATTGSPSAGTPGPSSTATTCTRGSTPSPRCSSTPLTAAPGRGARAAGPEPRRALERRAAR